MMPTPAAWTLKNLHKKAFRAFSAKSFFMKIFGSLSARLANIFDEDFWKLERSASKYL